MTTRPLSVGFAGLGVMGRPMASHLAAAGHAMTLFDVAPGLAQDVAASLAGGRANVASSPAELAARSDIVVTMVPNGAVVQEIVCGDAGLLRGLKPGSLVLDTSSSEPWLTEATGRLLAAAGVAMVDAPVSGRSGAHRPPSSSSCAAAARPISSACGRSSTAWAGRCSTSARSAPATR
jgi:3-hydroxyisobutyrate dehydrogenase-like beta-hydroxyacid dehydrogenase